MNSRKENYSSKDHENYIQSICKTLKMAEYGRSLILIHIYILLISILLEVSAWRFGLLSGILLKSIVDHDRSSFLHNFVLMATFAVSSSLLISIRSYSAIRLSIALRFKLTKSLHLSYLSTTDINNLQVDNIDQRISVDVAEFSKNIGLIFEKITLTPFVIILYSILIVRHNGYFTLISVYSFFIIGAFLQKIISKYAVNATLLLDKFEGNFRHEHSIIRSNRESIILSHLKEHFHSSVELLYFDILKQSQVVARWTLLQNIIGNSFAYLGGVLNYLILFLTTTWNSLSPSMAAMFISQGSFRILYLVSKLTDFVQIGSLISDVITFSIRINEVSFTPNVEDNLQSIKIAEEDFEKKEAASCKKIQITNGVIQRPDGRVLIRDIIVKVAAGQNVYITGPNGSGKTSLLRCLKGIWNLTTGSIEIKGNIECIPQEVVLPTGSINDIMSSSQNSTKEIQDVINQVGLTMQSTIRRSGEEWRREVLSPGEVCRLMIARTILLKPDFCLLDESTAALDEQLEVQFHQMLWQQGITTLTVGHRINSLLGRLVNQVWIVDQTSLNVIYNE